MFFNKINYSYRQVQRIIDEILNKISKIITTLDKQTDSTKEIFKIIFLENMS